MGGVAMVAEVTEAEVMVVAVKEEVAMVVAVMVVAVMESTRASRHGSLQYARFVQIPVARESHGRLGVDCRACHCIGT